MFMFQVAEAPQLTGKELKTLERELKKDAKALGLNFRSVPLFFMVDGKPQSTQDSLDLATNDIKDAKKKLEVQQAIVDSYDALLKTSDSKLLSIARETFKSLPPEDANRIAKGFGLTPDDLVSEPLTQNQQFLFTSTTNSVKNDMGFSLGVGIRVLRSNPGASSENIIGAVLRGAALSGLSISKTEGNADVAIPIKSEAAGAALGELHVEITGTRAVLCTSTCMAIDFETAKAKYGDNPEKIGSYVASNISKKKHVEDVLGPDLIRNLDKVASQVAQAYRVYLKQKEIAQTKDPGAIAFESYVALLQNAKQAEQMQSDRSSLQDIIDKYSRTGFV